MKKIFLSRRNALFSSATLSVPLVFVGVVVACLLIRLFLPGVWLTLTAPLFRTGETLTASATSFRSVFGDIAVVTAERDQLRDELAALTTQNLALSAKIDDLTALLGSEAPATLGVIAGVLARPPVSGYDTLIVAAGTSAGAAAGMRVFAGGGVPIGTVESVTQKYARITLYSAPGTTLQGWVGSDRVALTLTGAGGGAFTATLPKGVVVGEGDTIYAPGPGALPIGRVNTVGVDPSSPSVSLSITPLVNPFSITWVKLVP